MVLALLCLAVSMNAQVQFGIKTIYSQSLTNKTSKEFVPSSFNALHSFEYEGSQSHAGIGISLYVDNDLLFFSPDVVWTRSGRSFNFNSTSLSGTPLDPSINTETKETVIKSTIIGGLRLGDIKLGVGPHLSYAYSQSEDLSSLEVISNQDKMLGSGFNFLVGKIFFDDLHVDLKYSYTFQDASHEFNYQGVPMNLNSNPKFLELSLSLFL